MSLYNYDNLLKEEDGFLLFTGFLFCPNLNNNIFDSIEFLGWQASQYIEQRNISFEGFRYLHGCKWVHKNFKKVTDYQIVSSSQSFEHALIFIHRQIKMV